MKHLIFLLIFSFSIYSQTYISKMEAIEDIDFFFANAEQIHPNLYFNIPKQELQKQILLLKESIEDSIPVNEFSIKMRILVNNVGDGHTSVGFPQGLMKTYREQNTEFPFKINISNNKLFVAKSYTDKIQSGDEIVSINGVPAEELIKLKECHGGDSESHREKGFEKYFSLYVFAKYGFTDRVKVKLMRNGKLLLEEIKLSKPKQNNTIKYNYEKLGNIAVLKLNAFWGINKNDYRKFLDSVFSDINDSGIDLLIIDVRKNGGGNSSYGAMVLPYLNVTKYKFLQKYQIKSSKPLKKYIRKNFLKWYMYPLYPFLYLSPSARIYLFKKNGRITDFNIKEYKLKPAKNAYKGKVCVLTSGFTYSAAADFVAAFKYAKRGLIIGDTVGQPYSGYIDILPVILPNSKLPAGVSFKKYEYIGANDKNKYHGISPDIFINVENIDSEPELYHIVVNKCL